MAGPWVSSALRKAGGLLALLTLALPVAAGAGGAGAPEFSIKAVYLFKFFAFTDWPPGALGAAGEPVALCIVGRDPFGAVIDQAGEGQKLGDHPIEVRRLRQAVKGSGCRVMYVRGPAAAEAVATVMGEPVLIVTDGAPGGAIQFVVQGGKVRFAVDQAAARSGGVTLSSKLLAVATVVR